MVQVARRKYYENRNYMKNTQYMSIYAYKQFKICLSFIFMPAKYTYILLEVFQCM